LRQLTNFAPGVVRSGVYHFEFFMMRSWVAWKPRVIDHTTAIFRQVNKDGMMVCTDPLPNDRVPTSVARR
jgi:hypothetical protein